MSVTPASGDHDTTKEFEVSYGGWASTWEPGRIVSTIVQVSFAGGTASAFPATSVAVVANSYVPSPAAVKLNWPMFPDCVAYDVHVALPPVRYQRVTLATPVPFPSLAAYPTENVRVFSYAGRVPAVDVGASWSIMTNASGWLVAMSTSRGLIWKA